MSHRPWNNLALPAASLLAPALIACPSNTSDTADAGPTTGTPAANAAFVAAGFDAVFGARNADAIDTYFSPTFDPAVSCDLFRIENGLIAEHWDVLQTDPNSRGKTFDTLATNGAGHTMFQ